MLLGGDRDAGWKNASQYFVLASTIDEGQPFERANRKDIVARELSQRMAETWL